VSGSWITESETGSFLTNLNGAISSSSQLTSSYDTRYTLSGSVQPLPSNLVSSSAQITAFGFISSSATINTGSLATTGSNTFNGDETISGSLFISGTTELGGNIVPKTARGATLGTLERPFSEIFVSSGSINIASDTPGDPNTTLTNIGGNILVSAGGMRLVGDASFIATTGSFQYISGSMTQVGNYTQTGNYTMVGNKTISGSFRISGSGFINNRRILTDLDTGSFQANWMASSGSSQILNVNGTNGPTTIAIGRNTGLFTPPTYGVAIGNNAGESSQGEYGVAIGNGAGQLFQGTNAVAIGSAGYEDQGQYAIAIGAGAGDTEQGQYAIAIGAGAGANHQTANSIILDATNGTIQQAAGAGLHIAPIRSGSTTSNVLNYNTTTKEITYITSSFETTGRGIISGSSQLTSSFDSRYVLESETGSLQTSITNLNSFTQSFSTSVDSRLDTLEASIITGSINYVQVLGNRRTSITTLGVSIISGSITTTGNPVQIMVTGDANPVNVTSWTRLQIYRNETAIGNIVQVENSSNLNVPYCVNVIDTASAGTYTYSMRTVSGISGLFDFGETSGPTLTIVELNTNTNLPSTNNTFTGTNTFNQSITTKGDLAVGTSSGNEGGQINMALAATNQTLTGSVNIDVYQNRIRFWEGGGNARGVSIDLSKAPNSVNAELLWKASGFVDAGVDVTLGNLKARIPTTGNRSLQLSTVSGTYSVYGSSLYSYNGVGAVTLNNGTPLNVTTTPQYLAAGYNFLVAGATDTWNIMDTSAGIAWRITMILGASYNNNMISIERLV
jgi:hypothetical protein